MSEQKPPEAILKALGEPFPREAIKSRQGGGGKQFKYVEAETVIRRLNHATNGAWDFRVVSVAWHGDVMLCQGELTIPGLGTRTGFGVQKVVPNSGEDLLKGACSDALKKSATLFGVGLELYPGSDYEADATSARPVNGDFPYDAENRPGGTREPRPAPIRSNGASGNDLAATDRQRGLIQTLARELKISDDALDGRCVERFGVPLRDLNRRDASAIIEGLKEKQAQREGAPS